MNQSKDIFEDTSRFRQFVVDKLNSIEVLNIKQNGTIKDNIGDISNLKAWKNKIVGALIITDIILVPVTLALIINFIK